MEWTGCSWVRHVGSLGKWPWLVSEAAVDSTVLWRAPWVTFLVIVTLINAELQLPSEGYRNLVMCSVNSVSSVLKCHLHVICTETQNTKHTKLFSFWPFESQVKNVEINVFSPDLLRYIWQKCINLKCTMWWFDICIHCKWSPQFN